MKKQKREYESFFFQLHSPEMSAYRSLANNLLIRLIPIHLLLLKERFLLRWFRQRKTGMVFQPSNQF